MSIPDLHIEKEALNQIANGDAEAFRLFYDRFHNNIYSMAYKILGSAAASEDVVQEVFVKLWLQRARLPAVEQLSAYINTITRNHITNLLRREAIEDVYLGELLKEEGLAMATDEIQHRELQRHVQEAIAKLSPQQKKVFQLSRMDGLKYEEISRQLQISPSTVKFHIVEALKFIKKYLSYFSG